MDRHSHGHIVAIDDVEMEASSDCEPRLRWFYGEFINLETLPERTDPGGVRVLRFKSERIELHISLMDSPAIDSVECRGRFLVPSVHDAVEMLQEHSYPFRLVRGLSFTDLSIDLLDPAGNRVEVRRFWSGFPLQSPGPDL